jgi:ParB-like chromosome segregation protein Spo0J
MNKSVKTAAKAATGIVALELSKITVSGLNPRKTVSENELHELAHSIRQVGVLHPVLGCVNTIKAIKN